VYPGPYPGALRDVLGLTVEEWLPLRAGERVTLTWEEPGIAQPAADTWTEAVILAGAKPVAWYASGPAAGGPAITRHELGEGRSWYVSARTDAPTTAAVFAAACASAGLNPPAAPVQPGAWPPDLEIVRRTDGQRRFFMLINHGDTAAAVRLAGRVVTVPAGDVQVITGESDSGDQRRC
jgi:beta-galactosidase